MSYKLQIKQVDLSHVNQDDTKTRVLVIDPDGTVYWSLSSGGGKYTNSEPVPVTIGGIAAGSTFADATMQFMWDSLLYPYQSPAFTSFSITGTTPLEVGAPSNNPVLFTWNSSNDVNVNPNSVIIRDAVTGILLSGQPSDGTNVAYTYGSPVALTTAGTRTWNISGIDTHSITYIRSTSKSWYWKVYWGTSALTSAPTESLIENLLNRVLKVSRTGVYSFAANNYKYLALPAAHGIPTSITYNSLPFALADAADGYTLGSGNITYTQIPITNAFGILENYNIFRSKNPLVGVVSMTVS
jgi:hypothetical protein